ncbi:elongation factor-1 alpha [Thiomicrospira sp. R3]|uniref:elongation factor-1 alpha n=1 Tax=Thiomicrospira sp. R3 TaxID=3035472 RepID=UPI00259BA06E|nr:elongation factor-1 alpha [Thiomicrospira sp. R3]WFE69557.1 elongation factor-1 alpha [Thiomicrospira sp. R3]
MKETSRLNLTGLSISVKSLFTGYILVVGVGLLMAGLQILLSHGMADGKPGLSIDDIVYSYHGNRTGSTLEAKLHGSMKDMAPNEQKLVLIKWARDGAPEEQWEPIIKPITQQYCVACHSTMPGLSDFTKLSEMQRIAEVDTGKALSTLTRLSHIHLFGISFIFFFVGLIFSLAVGFKPWVKALIIFTPFAFLIVDIAAWWLTKLSPGFAWFVMIGGIGYSVAAAVMLFTSLYQMWIMPLRGQISDQNAWLSEK